MRRERVADAILALVLPRERAASVAGDLIEEAGVRGQRWFWTSVARTALSCLWHDLVAAPVALIASAVLAWFVYMGLSLVLVLIGMVLVMPVWGAAYFLTHHTGLELLANLVGLRIDWPPLPFVALYSVQAIVVWVLAPFQMGRLAGRSWRGHELSICLAMALVWSAMAVLVPFVVHGVSASPSMMPAIGACLLFGGVWERHAQPTTTSGAPTP